MKKTTTLTLATGVAFAATVALAPVAQAANSNDSPFGMAKLGSGYQLAAADDKMKDGKCGEGKCGGAKKADDKKMDDKKKDAACGAKK